MSNAYTEYSRHIINMLLAVLIASTAALYPACEHEIFPQALEWKERELVGAKQKIEPLAEQKMGPEVAQEIEQSQAAVAANPQQIRAALEAALKNQNSEEGSEQLQALLEHEIAKMPEKIKAPLLNMLLKQAFFAQSNPDDTYAMELLLEAKADPSALTNSHQDQASSSALHFAILASNTQAVQLFLDHGADPLITNDIGLSSLETHSSRPDAHALLISHTIQRLKARQLNPNYQDPHTRQPLLSMALNVQLSFLPHIVPLVKVLLDRHANPNIPDKNGKLPLYTIVGYRKISEHLIKIHKLNAEELYRTLDELEKMLREHGAQEYAAPAQDWTCLIQ